MKGGVRPARLAAMRAMGLLDAQAAAALPPIAGIPMFMTPSQVQAALAYVAANWHKAVG